MHSRRKNLSTAIISLCLMALASTLLLTNAEAQTWDMLERSRSKWQATSDIGYMVEMQASVSKGSTPLWLNANKHGLSSLDANNGYLRAAVERKVEADSTRRWGVGYGIDMAVAKNFTSTAILQQAYIQLRWLHGSLTVGSREHNLELKNSNLSSGSQTLGINARPIPQVRLALDDYWVTPFFNDWLRLKGHIAYGMMTDQNWQHDFTSKKTKYADNVLYHSKAGYIMIGNPDRFYPFSVELGLEMATTFGGTAYRPKSDGTMEAVEGERGLKALWNAFVPGGAESVEKAHKNMAGNHVGSWLIRLNYDEDTWRLSIYADKFFEDHSGMFLLDYDGYGSGSQWQEAKKWRFVMYDLKDIMLGAELKLKDGAWLQNVVAEYVYTKYQSGPFLHEHSAELPDHIGGNDNFYNHYIYTGWQHWGQVIGNPLYRSPIYNTDGNIEVKNSRFVAYHIGVSGSPTDQLSYRLRASYQDGLGTYQKPYLKKQHNFSFALEATYALPHGWTASLAYGMDFGHILGDNRGAQFTVRKCGLLTGAKKK